MRNHWLTLCVIAVAVLCSALVFLDNGHADVTAAYDHLNAVMDQFHDDFDIYTDGDAGGNHFTVYALMGNRYDILTFDPYCTEDVGQVGEHSLKVVFTPVGDDWAGLYFMSGVLLPGDEEPLPDWGDYIGGIDLTGATTLTFRVLGAVGGEKVEFFMGGIGLDAPHLDPDSAVRTPASTEYTLTGGGVWDTITISLTGVDLSSVKGGFGLALSASKNPSGATFYLDEIRYDKARLEEPRFLQSYKGTPPDHWLDPALRNASFVSDNVITLLAYLLRGTPDDDRRAQLVADALLYARDHDRYFSDGRLRNAYQSGDLSLPPGWTPNGRVGATRLPEWWDGEAWCEDPGQVGTYVETMGWAILALSAYVEELRWKGREAEEAPYLEAASQMGEWVENNCRDTRGAGGYEEGYKGPDEAPQKLWTKRTEDNALLYAAFRRLYSLTSDTTWITRADYARAFVEAMWTVDDQGDDHFWYGTLADGIAFDTWNMTLKAHIWPLLALGDSDAHRRAMDWALAAMAATAQVGGQTLHGFDYNDNKDGIWWEGTAQMAEALACLGRWEGEGSADFYLTQIEACQLTHPQADEQGLMAATPHQLTTGFPGWTIPERLHIGATGWMLLAANRYNPFWSRTQVFPDVPPSYWAADEIGACYEAGIVAGYWDGYHPDQTVNRAQMAVFIGRAIAGGDTHVPTGPSAATFPDVPTTHWAFRYVEYCYAQGVVTGYWDGYRPEETVNRAQMAVYVSRAIAGGDAYVPSGPDTATFMDVPTDHWAYRYIEYCHDQEVVSGYWDGYHPDEAVTRAQMAVYVYRSFLEQARYVVSVDEHSTPLPTDVDCPNYYDATGGDRGLLHAEEVSYAWDGDTAYTATAVSSSGAWTWGGMWYSLSRIDRDNMPLDFGAIFGSYVKPQYQGEITDVDLVVSDLDSPSGNLDLELRIELKDEYGALVASRTWPDLTGQSYPRVLAWLVPEESRQRVETILWVLDKAQPGDSISVDSVALRARVPGPSVMPTRDQAFLWTYAWLTANYDPSTGMVQDRSNFGSGDFENVPATAKAAKIAYYAYRKGYTTREDAETVVTKIADVLINTLPRGPSGTNTLWPHFTRAGGSEALPPHDGYAGSEWSSGDSAFAALDAIAALEMLGDPQEQIGDLEGFLRGINWVALRQVDGSVSHGYAYTGEPLPGSWRGFGMETVGVNWAYAGATGDVGVMDPPPSDNGSGFIDNASYPMIFSGVDRWGNDWDAYRSDLADLQIGWYTSERNPYLAEAGLFGLSAAEVPEARLCPAQLYQAYGVGGRWAGPEDGNGEVIVLHYAGMIADIRPHDAAHVWETLRDRRADHIRDQVVLSPLNNMESMRGDKVTGKFLVNPLKGSWNLALQAEGWALADPVVRADLAAAVLSNGLLRSGYEALKGD